MYHRKFKYVRERREVAFVEITNGKIIAHHLENSANIKSIPIKKLILSEKTCDNFVHEITKFNKVYSPQFFKTKFRYLEYLEDDDSMLELYQKDFSTRFFEYLSIYTEDELNKIILDFGKTVYKWMNKRIDGFNYKTYEEFLEKSMNIMIENLSKVNSAHLLNTINNFVIKIGCPPDIVDNKSCWNNFIYMSLIMYLYIEKKAGTYKSNIDYYKLFQYMCHYKVQCEYEHFIYPRTIFITPNNKSIVHNVNYLEEYMNNYLYERYYNPNAQFWYDDHMIDLLDEHQNYLLSITKDDKKKEKINKYTIEELDRSYNRKIKGY